MNPFKRRTKPTIQILKKEALSQAEEPPPVTNTEPTPKAQVAINILGKEQLRTDFSSEELRTAAQQVQQEFAELTLPKSVSEARHYRQAGRLDEAMLLLQESLRQFGNNPDIEEELRQCFMALQDEAQFQTIANSQIAAIFFHNAGFHVREREPMQTPQMRGLIETRLLVYCADADLTYNLEAITGAPLLFFCYCLAEFEGVLDTASLGAIQQNFKGRGSRINRRVNFVICRESSPEMNMVISVASFTQQFTTIPLEREEMRRAILNHTDAAYLQSKLRSWLDNYRLFATTLPVTRQGEFFGRENEYRELKQTIDRGDSFYILGMRRIGKTSLVQYLHHIGAFRTYLYAYIDTEGYWEQSNFDKAATALYDQWIEELQRKYVAIAPIILTQVLPNDSPYERLVAFLEALEFALRQQQIDTRCVVILDDLNLLLEPREAREPLWEVGGRELIRLLRQHRELVVTGLTLWDFATRDRLETEPAGGYGKYNSIYLQPLNSTDCAKMITYIGGIINMEFPPATLAAIYVETGGHPLWTRFLCDDISRKRLSRNERIIVTLDQVAQAADHLLNLETRLFHHGLVVLSAEERQALHELAAAPQPLPLRTTHAKVLAQLEEYGFIERPSTAPESYQLRMRILARYLQSLNHTRQESVTTDAGN